MIPIAYHFPEYGIDVLAIGALVCSSACVLFPQDQRGMYVKRLLPTFFGLLYVPFLLHYFVRILKVAPPDSVENGLGFGLFFCLWIVVVAKFSDMGALLVGKAIGRTKMAPSIVPKNHRGASWRISCICWHWSFDSLVDFELPTRTR